MTRRRSCWGSSWSAGLEAADAFAVEDAFALRAEIAIARLQPALDPRLRTFLDRARHRLHGVADEAGLDAALDEFRPILDALARWPRPRDPSPSGAGGRPAGRPDLSWPDRRALRFCAAFSLRPFATGPRN